MRMSGLLAASEASEGDSGGHGATEGGAIDSSVLRLAASIAARAPPKWGRVVVLRALRQAVDLSPAVRARARRLMALREVVENPARAGESGAADEEEASIEETEAAASKAAGDAAGDENASIEPPDGHGTALDGADLGADHLRRRLAPSLGEGSSWCVCHLWSPTALGEPPPHSAVLAVSASSGARERPLGDADGVASGEASAVAQPLVPSIFFSAA